MTEDLWYHALKFLDKYRWHTITWSISKSNWMIQELNQFIWYEIWVLIVNLFYVSMLYHIVFHDGPFLVIFSLLFGLVYQILTVLNLQRNPNAWHPDPNSTLAIDQSPKLHQFTIFGTILGAVFSFQTILAQSPCHMAIKATNACSYFIWTYQHHHRNHYLFHCTGHYKIHHQDECRDLWQVLYWNSKWIEKLTSQYFIGNIC